MGKSQSGKTTMGLKLIQYMMVSVDELLLCSATYNQPAWDPIRHKVKHASSTLELFLDDVKARIQDSKKPKRLVILDDVSYDKKLNEGNKGTLNELAYNAVWYNITLLVICHKTSNVGAGMKEHLSHLLLFNTISMVELQKLSEHFNILANKRAFLNLYKEVVADKVNSGENPYAFLYIFFGPPKTEVFSCFNNSITL